MVKQNLEEKPVGEILKEEGIIKDEEEVEGEQGKEEVKDVSASNLIIEIEKLKAIVDTFKTIKSDTDQRIRELAESVGELRSLFFQNDSELKKIETKIEKIEEDIDNIKPEKIRKRLEEKDKEISLTNAKIEKLEEMGKDFNQRLTKLEKILENIRSIENLKEIVNEIDEKLKKIENLKNSVERDAAKTERFFLETEKRFKEFEEVKKNVNKIDEITKELVRNVDEIRIKVEAAATKDELEKIIEEKLSIGKNKEEKIAKKEKEINEIISLLRNVEAQYKKGYLSEEAYEEITSKNRTLLEKLESEINRLKSEEGPKDVGEAVDFLQEKVEELSSMISAIEKKVNAIEEREKERSKLKKEVPMEEVSPKVDLLMQKLKEAEDLMKILEDQYRKGMISERTYNEVKTKNLEYMEKIKNELATIKASRAQIKELPLDIIKRLVDHLSKLEELIAIQNERIFKLEDKINLFVNEDELAEIRDLREKIENIRKNIQEARRGLSFILE